MGPIATQVIVDLCLVLFFSCVELPVSNLSPFFVLVQSNEGPMLVALNIGFHLVCNCLIDLLNLRDIFIFEF